MPINPPSDNAKPPQPKLGGDENSDSAVNLIRDKVARIYGNEPAALEELDEAKSAQSRSKYQDFMYSLSSSGLDLATIQTKWHEYYTALPAHEKHQVWQEFYDSQSVVIGHSHPLEAVQTPQAVSEHKHSAAHSSKHRSSSAHKLRDARSTADVQAAIRHKVTAGGKLKAKHHVQSLLFGLGMGALVVFIFLFGFFNEVIIAPFIQPSRVVAATPLIVSSNSIAATSTPEVIIPKINVEIPVNYSETSTDESAIENDLEDGVVHYPTTVLPGQVGNAAFFGHSSNNIFNKGKYKFAFVLLHTLVPGDTFYLTYNSKVYVYKVISRTIVDPSDVGVLGPVAGQTATATLITCDPPGTSLHRLIVVGQQISPDPSSNAPTPTQVNSLGSAPSSLPGNGPTLWGRFISTTLGKSILVILILLILTIGLRRLTRPKDKS